MERERKWTPRTAKCLCCNETHRFTRPKEFWQCSCSNQAMHDSGDEFYARTGAADVSKIMVWKDGELPDINHQLIEYYAERNNPAYVSKVKLAQIKKRLDELKAHDISNRLERKQLLEDRKRIKGEMKNGK